MSEDAYDDDRPGMMRVHIAQQRADVLCARYNRNFLRRLASQNGVPTGYTKRDLAIALVLAGVEVK